MNDLISRQAAIDAVYGAFRVKDVDDFVDYRDIAVETIKVLPSAQPEIIYCKDCKWSDWYDAADGHRYCYCMETGAAGRTVDDFCSYAER